MGETNEGARQRDHFIPVRKSDLIQALIAHGALDGEAQHETFQQFCRRLDAISHHVFFGRLERLRDDYFYFSPEFSGVPPVDAASLERSYKDLIATLENVLTGATFVEIPHHEIHRAHREHALVHVHVEAPLERYRDVRFYRRGHHRETAEVSRWYGWRKRHVEIDVYDDVVMLAALKANAPRLRRALGRRSRLRPGAVLLKHFHNIARADLHALFPDLRVVMGPYDRVKLGLAALVGGVPILVKIASTATVLFVVAGFYLGLGGSARETDVAGATAAVGALIAFGGFIGGQWIRFQRQSLIYQQMVSDNVYYRNVNSNAGIFDTIIGEAEEQVCKEVALAYYFLLCDGASNEEALERRIEQWLQRTFNAAVAFKGKAALERLGRLNLLRHDGGRLTVLPLDEAMQQLGGTWSRLFTLGTLP